VYSVEIRVLYPEIRAGSNLGSVDPILLGLDRQIQTRTGI